MAVTTRTYTIPAFWNSDSIISTLQTALSDVAYHCATRTGTVLTFTNTVGTTIAGQIGRRYLVKQSATSGTGTGATFDVLRSPITGAILTVTMVEGGIGYVATNTITIQGSTIGGANTTDDIVITAATVSGAQGSTTTWYDVDAAVPATWGVACVNIDGTKKMGQTFYSFWTPASPTLNPILYIRSFPGFQSVTNVINGVAGLDYFSATNVTSNGQQGYSQVIASSNAVALTLTTYQSGVDNKFVIFQFSEESKYGKLTRWPFFLSNYQTATQPWSLDECYTGGIYEMVKVQNTNTTEGIVGTTTVPSTMGKRQGEWGYGNLQGTYTAGRTIIGYYESIYGKRTVNGGNQVYSGIYQRTLHDLAQTSLEYNPVVTGIPICNVMVPCPYFIPVDIGVTEIVNTNNVEYGDLISVGATTKWKVIQYGNNQTAQTYNGTMAFVVKTVD